MALYFLNSNLVESFNVQKDWIGTSYDEKDKYIALSDKQIVFHTYYPDASADEVYKLTLDINRLKSKRIEEINEYDVSENVNSFYINNIALWLTRDERGALRSDCERLLKNSETTIRLFAGVKLGFIDIPLSTAITMLDEVEEYARKSFLVTNAHILEIYNSTDIDFILNYDITAGYPDKPNLKL